MYESTLQSFGTNLAHLFIAIVGTEALAVGVVNQADELHVRTRPFNCMYCMSFWFALILTPYLFDYTVISWLLSLVTWRLSFLLHIKFFT